MREYRREQHLLQNQEERNVIAQERLNRRLNDRHDFENQSIFEDNDPIRIVMDEEIIRGQAFRTAQSDWHIENAGQRIPEASLSCCINNWSRR
jgi:hypothetical protein